jgi:uncharacterized repeat protein (TIGR01451 family)
MVDLGPYGTNVQQAGKVVDVNADGLVATARPLFGSSSAYQAVLLDLQDVPDPSDTTDPVLTMPADIVVDATSTSGAVVAIAPTATDDTDPDPTLACTAPGADPPSFEAPANVQFPIGVTTIECEAEDDAANVSEPGVSTVTVRSADVSVTIAGPDTIFLGDSLTHTIVVTNHGPTTAIDVSLADIIASVPGSAVSFGEVTTTVGSCAPDGDALVCLFGDLAPDTGATVTIELQPAAIGTVMGTAVAAGTQFDLNFSNNLPLSLESSVQPAPGPVDPCNHPGGETAYAVGRNEAGMLGLGYSSAPSWVALPVTQLSEVVEIVGGGTAAIARLEDGSVCAWGWNLNSTFIPGLPGDQLLRPTSVPDLEGFDSIALGQVHGLGTRDGTLLAWGSDGFGEAGPTFHGEPTVVPTTGPPGATFVDVSTSYYHSLALTADGRIYAFGRNDRGQLGIGNNAPQEPFGWAAPVVGLPQGDPVRHIATDLFASAAATESGRILGWGLGPGGSPAPVELATLPPPIRALEVQSSRVYVVDGAGNLWEVMRFAAPRPLQAGEVFVDLQANGHILARTADGRAYGWGSNAFGQLTTAASAGYNAEPVLLPFDEVTSIGSGGAGFSVILGESTGPAPDAVESGTATWPASGPLLPFSTDDEGDGATDADPVETLLQPPSGLSGYFHASLFESPLSEGATTGGFALGGLQVSIFVQPGAPAASPWIASFDVQIPPSALPPAVPPDQTNAFVDAMGVFRNGVPVPECVGSAPPYAAYPCVIGRTLVGDDARIRVAALQFSDWTFGFALPTANAGGPYTVAEGSSVALSAAGSSGTGLTYEWTGPVQLSDPTSATPTVQGFDDGTFDVFVQVIDSVGMSNTGAATLTVTNVNPTVTTLTGPTTPVAMGTAAQANVAFADQGVVDTHTVQIAWGDGTSTAAVVNQVANTATASHAYGQAGLYTVTATVTDDDGGSASASYQSIVVFDRRGVVAGAGTIQSQAGWCKVPAACLTKSGNAVFTIAGAYRNNGSTPIASTTFTFAPGGLVFTSTSHDWLLVNPAANQAQLSGSGRINLKLAPNGQPYRYQVWVGDSPSSFRIRIWYGPPSAPIVVYDTLTQRPLKAGSISVSRR